MNRQGLLFINLGTPRSPKKPDVKKFLRDFLMDRDVISLPFLGRWLLVNLIIVPFRASYSASIYSKIWTADGSPLALISESFAEQVQQLHPELQVEFAMRYPKESLQSTFRKFRNEGITDITVVPMYPQRTRSNYLTTMKEVRRLTQDLNIKEIAPLYNNPEYITCQANLCKAIWQGEHIIFSFHSIPTKHENTTDSYKEQCYTSASLIARELGTKSYSVAFQSKMGKGEWLEPQLRDILTSGEHSEVIVVPAGFTTDCLETLYELDIEMRELFLQSGGKVFKRVPALNDSPEWVRFNFKA